MANKEIDKRGQLVKEIGNSITLCDICVRGQLIKDAWTKEKLAGRPSCCIYAEDRLIKKRYKTTIKYSCGAYVSPYDETLQTILIGTSSQEIPTRRAKVMMGIEIPHKGNTYSMAEAREAIEKRKKRSKAQTKHEQKRKKKKKTPKEPEIYMKEGIGSEYLLQPGDSSESGNEEGN